MSAAVGSGALMPCSYCCSADRSRCWSMSLSTTLRRPLAAWGWAIGSNADGDATIPASRAASHGVSFEAHFGSGAPPALVSPQPPDTVEVRRAVARQRLTGGRRRDEAVLLAEVHARGRLDPVRAVAEIDRVQILGEDLRLLPLAGEVVGERRLTELLEHGPVVLLGERVLDELLSDRRGALARAAGDVGDERAGDAADVDARVRPEALVLDRDDRVPHRGGDVAVLVDDDVVRRREDPDRPPLVVVQERVRLVLVLAPVLELGEVRGDRHHHPEDGRDERERAEADEDQEQAELAHPRLRRAFAVAASPPASAWRAKRDRRVRIRVLYVIVFAHANRRIQLGSRAAMPTGVGVVGTS